VRVGIHQPNYFPYQGYFYKMMHCDTFVFMDDVQFPQGRSFCYRNRIRTSNGTMWISVPTRREKKVVRISEVLIDNNQNWSEKHLRTFYHAYSRSPYFKAVFPLLEEALSASWEYLVQLNIHLIRVVCRYMGIEKSCKFIRMKDVDAKGKSTDLLIDICRRVGADTYVSGVTGKKYLEERKFEAAGLRLAYCVFNQPKYAQLWSGEFVPNLSILDLLFNCGPESKKTLLNTGSS
jgi:hypothetical protein